MKHRWNRGAPVDDDDILAEAGLGYLSVEPDSATAWLQVAIATAVRHGKPNRQDASVARMRALEVVDAAEAVTYDASPTLPDHAEAHNSALDEQALASTRLTTGDKNNPAC